MPRMVPKRGTKLTGFFHVLYSIHYKDPPVPMVYGVYLIIETTVCTHKPAATTSSVTPQRHMLFYTWWPDAPESPTDPGAPHQSEDLSLTAPNLGWANKSQWRFSWFSQKPYMKTITNITCPTGTYCKFDGKHLLEISWGFQSFFRSHSGKPSKRFTGSLDAGESLVPDPQEFQWKKNHKDQVIWRPYLRMAGLFWGVETI